MMPEQRYRVVPHTTMKGWGVTDKHTATTIVARLPTRHLANQVLAAMCTAWYAGADAIKSGEVVM
jgi:hypothetical protein